MTDGTKGAGILTSERHGEARAFHRGDGQGPFLSRNNRTPMKGVLVGMLALSVGLAGCIDLPFGTSQAQALDEGAYVRDVQVAVHSLTFVFAQADESVKAFQNGWLAPEGAASQFGLLHSQVKDIRSEVGRATPPTTMQTFHRDLGRSLSLTGQAMDAMQGGFSTGDPSYFQLAQEQLAEARVVLDRALNAL